LGALIGVPNWGPKLGSQIGVPKYPFVVVCLAVVVCYIKGVPKYPFVVVCLAVVVCYIKVKKHKRRKLVINV
jgi:type III secretory pathway component EscV